MRTFLQSSLVWAGILLSFASQAQDDAPLGVLPMQYNSSFAGEAESPRLNTSIGFTTPAKYSSRGIAMQSSYDQFVPALRSGIGVSTHYSRRAGEYGFGLSGSGQSLSYESQGYGFAVAVAPKFSLKGKYTLSPSLDFSYSSLRFSQDYWPGINERQEGNGFNIQSRAAILFNTPKWYAGYSVDLFQYGEAHYRIPISWPTEGRRFNSYWQFGYTFQRSSESKFSFTPQLLFRTGYDTRFIIRREFRYFALTALNLNFRYRKAIWGFNNAGFHVGWQTKPMQIGRAHV